MTGSGTVDGIAGLRAGRAVNDQRLGAMFDGSYRLRRVVHRYDRVSGYRSEVDVERWGSAHERGRCRAAALRRHRFGTAAGWPGVHIGVVTDNQDPDGQGRVKVRLPWAPDGGSSRYDAWARVATMMAGNDRGTWFVPDLDDEVLVAFAGGDPRRPVVIGIVVERQGHAARDDEATDNPKRTILTGAGVRITLDDTKGRCRCCWRHRAARRVAPRRRPRQR